MGDAVELWDGERGWVIVVLDPEAAERDLAAGAIDCPRCGGGLARWGYARRRMVRGPSGPVWLRPRRAWCARCGRTQVLLPASCVPRRRDQVDQIGHALLAAARGQGHRPIAARLGVPEATVRGWLRRARTGAESARHVALRWAHRLDANLAAIQPEGVDTLRASKIASLNLRGSVVSLAFTAQPRPTAYVLAGDPANPGLVGAIVGVDLGDVHPASIDGMCGAPLV